MTGRTRGRRCSAQGIGLFVDERGSTTVGAAVAILVSLALLFGAATAQWVGARSADVQAVADAGALAGMNVVAGYATAVHLVDAVVLSMGLVGMVTLAVGVVVSAIPLVDAAGPPILTAAQAVFEARSSLAASAGRGFKVLEGAVPYLVAANSLLAVRANALGSGDYVGLAVPYPTEGASDFGGLVEDDVSDGVRTTVELGKEIDELSQEARRAQERADDALERGWRADCGGDPSMRERAQSLAGMQGAQNPQYPTVTGWDFGVAVLRARSYYAQRLAQEAPSGSSVDELVRSCARRAFYTYAFQMVQASSVTYNEDGTVTCDLRDLPANTDGVRSTSLYTDALWYCSMEEGGRTIHCSSSCPGAVGPAAGLASVADEESGACAQCPVCRFTVVDIGRAPAASTSIENGFEHHWRAVVEASREYEDARADLAQCEQREREASEGAVRDFGEALANLRANRVKLQPPGRYGCVCVVADPHSHASPAVLAGALGRQTAIPARAAVSAAVLARDDSADAGTVLGDFFDGLVARGGGVGATAGVLDSVMTAWGGLLVSYGDGYDAFMSSARSSLQKLGDLGMGRVSDWLKGALEGVIELTSIEPADLSVRRPVLTNSADVMQRAGNDWYMAVRAYVQAVQHVGPDAGPREVLAALGVFLQTYQGSTVITVAEFKVPGLDVTVPIELDLGWLAELGDAA